MSEVSDVARASSRTATVMGTAVIILGLLAIFAPTISGIAVGTIVAILLLAAGIAGTLFAFQSKSFGEGLLQFLWAGFTAVCGAVMLARPLFGLASLTMVVGIYFIVQGLARVLAGFQLKPVAGWGWLIFDGLTAFLLAFMILREWPLSGEWAIGVLVGAHLLLQGWSLIMLGGVGAVAADELEAEGV